MGAQGAAALVRRMAQLSGTREDDWFLVAKARQGMQVAMRAAAGALGRDEVVSQLFTCITAVVPILAAGLRPRYAEVDPATLALDVGSAAPGANVCAVVLQHTFGIVDEASSREVAGAAHAAGAIVVEDCAHCVGRLARDERGEPVADVSVHSFGVEKMLANTYFGGAVWVNPCGVAAVALREALGALPEPDGGLERAAHRYRNQMRVLTRLPYAASAALRTRWERSGRLEPAVSEQERRGRTNHEPSRPSLWMCEQALAALSGIEENERGRRACVEAYREALGADGRALLGVPAAAADGPAQPLLRFPVFVAGERQADAASRAIAELGFYAPPWPRPLLVPGMLDADAFGLAQGFDAWPLSLRLSEGAVALPTDIDPARVPDVAQAVLSLARDR